MKYIDEFRDGGVARGVAAAIAAEARTGRDYHFMEFCGGHTHAIARYGLEELLPPNVHMVHGPGCPVCVLPMGRIDNAIALARTPGVILCSYGDMLRVPGSGRMSLLQARAEGCDVRMMYSILDAIRLARERPDRKIVFFAIGFETTTPPTAAAVKQAHATGLKNFLVFCNHVLTPPAIRSILDSPEVAQTGAVRLDGFVGPSHVSMVIGSGAYEPFASMYRRPVVIAGFEPLDVMQSILMLVRQINAGRHEVENQYRRAVSRGGNRIAQDLMAEVLELRPAFEWRGLGLLPDSALRVRDAWAAFDAERHFDVPPIRAPEPSGCQCGAILRGVMKPEACPLFGRACTPENPVGSCMVSGEGSCAARYRSRLDRAAAMPA